MRFNLQRFAAEPEVNVDVTVEGGEGTPAPETTPPASDGAAVVDSLIFTQEQINEINAKIEGVRSEIEQLWQSQFNDWKSGAISDLEARVDALEVAAVVDAVEDTTPTVDDTTIVEPPPSDTPAADDTPPADDTPARRKPGFLF